MKGEILKLRTMKILVRCLLVEEQRNESASGLRRSGRVCKRPDKYKDYVLG